MVLLVECLFNRLIAITSRGRPESPQPHSSPVISVDLANSPHQVSVLSDEDEPESAMISVGQSEALVQTEISVGHNGHQSETISVGHEPVVESKPEQLHEPYGLASILELVRVLVSLIDPKNHHHTDTMHRRVGLNLMCVAIETGGTALSNWIGQQNSESQRLAVQDLIINQLFKSLFQVFSHLN